MKLDGEYSCLEWVSFYSNDNYFSHCGSFLFSFKRLPFSILITLSIFLLGGFVAHQSTTSDVTCPQLMWWTWRYFCWCSYGATKSFILRLAFLPAVYFSSSDQPKCEPSHSREVILEDLMFLNGGQCQWVVTWLHRWPHWASAGCDRKGGVGGWGGEGGVWFPHSCTEQRWGRGDTAAADNASLDLPVNTDSHARASTQTRRSR